MFGLYVLLSRPDTFNRYVIGSPWIGSDDHAVFRLEAEHADTHADLPARVFFGAGALEPDFILRNMRKFVTALDRRHYPSLRIDSQVFEGETHVSVGPTTTSRGLRAIYR